MGTFSSSPTTTNHQDQNNNETPHDIPNSERRYDMACLKFLSSSTTWGLFFRLVLH
ncbi:32749_t:CDS:2, partial [Racocetra persica]